MADFNSDAVVSTAWLAEHLTAPDVRVVDASYYLPDEGLSGRQEFELQHIPGAVFFDIDDIADSNDPLPHMLPAPEKFSSKVRRLGLGDGVRMVIYDQRGLMSAPRVWWTFRYFGHDDVAVVCCGRPESIGEPPDRLLGDAVQDQRQDDDDHELDRGTEEEAHSLSDRLVVGPFVEGFAQRSLVTAHHVDVGLGRGRGRLLRLCQQGATDRWAHQVSSKSWTRGPWVVR